MTPAIPASDGSSGGVREGGGPWSLVLAALLALMTALTVEVLFLFAGAGVAAVTGWERGPTMTAAVAVVSLVAWAIAGAVAFEAARRRAAAIAAAFVPVAIVVVLLAFRLVVGREALGVDAAAAALSGAALGAAAYAGGRVRERRIRRRAGLQ
jgi:hypothetical protein